MTKLINCSGRSAFLALVSYQEGINLTRGFPQKLLIEEMSAKFSVAVWISNMLFFNFVECLPMIVIEFQYVLFHKNISNFLCLLFFCQKSNVALGQHWDNAARWLV